MPRGQLPSAWHLRWRFASFQRQRAPADPPNSTFRAYTPLRWFMTSAANVWGGWLGGRVPTSRPEVTRGTLHIWDIALSAPPPRRGRFFDRMQTHFTRQRGEMGVKPRSRWALTVCRLEWQGHGQGERQGGARVRVAIRICAACTIF